MAVARSRVLDLMKAQCRIFSTTFNPTNIRTGNKVLRQGLKGPALAAYYPRKVVTIRDLQKLYPNFETWDEEEEDRVEHILMWVVPFTKVEREGRAEEEEDGGRQVNPMAILSTGECANPQ
ncbi:hypothetical protein B0A49_10590 [Cryomyces minteri]|uniref:Small ribosomal subunit protein mS33 n=1 Tax=Cryomyces minteri TaxID=331657 RepID=A0A4U0W1K5_9PEZI|nr:hypothetical protein B0A49_10590 [Cryomyces minteri]